MERGTLLYQQAIAAAQDHLEILTTQQEALESGRHGTLSDLISQDRAAIDRRLAIKRCLDALAKDLPSHPKSWTDLSQRLEQIHEEILVLHRSNADLLAQRLASMRTQLQPVVHRSRSYQSPRPSLFDLSA